MNKNDWQVDTSDLFDLEVTTQGKELRVKTKDNFTDLKIRFEEHSQKRFVELMPGIQTGEHRRINYRYGFSRKNFSD